MIDIFGFDDTPYNRGLMASKINARVVSSLTDNNFIECTCVCGCEPFQKVFAKVGGEWWKNDVTSFLFNRVTPTDTITMKLFRNGIEIENLNDNDFGTYYDFGSLPNADYKGYKLEWEEVFDSYGYGEYQIRTEIVSLGDTIDIDSLIYECCEYTDALADGTVRIETYQNGYIMSSNIDYTGMNWYQSYRIEGFFGYKKPTFETDNYQNSARDITQIQDKLINLYTLETKMLPSNLMNAITYDGLLANRILITDHNLCNFERYKRLEVYPDSIDDFTTFQFNVNALGTFKFTDKKQNIIKRNFY
jgi:hypothetical protein